MYHYVWQIFYLNFLNSSLHLLQLHKACVLWSSRPWLNDLSAFCANYVIQTDSSIHWHSVDSGDFWAKSVRNLVFPSPSGYMLTSFSFFFINLRFILYIPLKWSVIFPHLELQPVVSQLNWFICNQPSVRFSQLNAHKEEMQRSDHALLEMVGSIGHAHLTYKVSRMTSIGVISHTLC